ncbi:MAG: DUF1080 domain-containing protein [Verrucomicrobia bacterium]|nr:DUF1080 domain-containing protein [Verrucomicrobiota bacterium]
MKKTSLSLPFVLGLVLCGACGVAFAADDAKPFVGNWALTIPGGGAGWLGVEEKDGCLKASVLWGGGSVLPATGAKVEDGKLVVTRIQQPKGKDGKPGKKITETITATRDGDCLKLVTVKCAEGGKEFGRAEFIGKRIPPVPAAPDLSKVKFGEPVCLFNGKDLSGWKVLNPNAPNGWSAKDGILVNDAPQEPGKHKGYANIRTEREFEDFRLTLEVRVPKGGNSGVYLRGIYEVQVADTCGKPLDSHNMGGVYSRITPTVAAEKPAGEWQTMDITLVDRHVTVILNGRKIVDNQPVLGCTGGALTSDEFRAGPIYFQGDHTSVDYRNIVIRPVAK